MKPTPSPFRSRGRFGNLAAAVATALATTLATILATTMALLVTVLPAAAADADRRQLSEEQRARLEARIEEVRDRLALTDEQKAALEPVLRKDFERRIAILNEHGVTRESDERPSRREARALRRDLKAAKEEAEKEITRILDDRQMEEYRRIQDEAREAMRERIRTRQQPPAR